MGNKLCAPLLSKKGYPHEDHPWHIRKDSHLLRLWAEIFRVHGSGEFVHWERVSDDVVPINISCVEDTPKTIFQVTAYNKHVEKIFDIRIVQPGTILCPATECFVHWRDQGTHSEWGLNFSTPSDAKRFRDCCSYPSQKFARKASSANSLRLSPPKGRGRAVSSPNSPVSHPRRVVSSPHDLTQPEPCECIAPSGDREALARADKAATIPRTQAEADQDAAIFQPRGILKPPSSMSVYDNVGGNYVVRKKQGPATGQRRSLHIEDPANSKTVGRNNSSGVKTSIYTGTRSASAGPLSSYQGDGSYVPGAGQQGTFTSFGKDGSNNNMPRSASSRVSEPVRVETAFIGNIENVESGRKSVTIANIPDEIEPEPELAVPEDDGLSSTTEVRKDCIRILAPQPQKLLLPESPRSRESESPEWPSPPEPLTPLTPVNPVCNMDFDSDSIKKLLQNLPLSPEGEVKMTSSQTENDLGFHDDPCFVGMMTCELKPGCSDNQDKVEGQGENESQYDDLEDVKVSEPTPQVLSLPLEDKLGLRKQGDKDCEYELPRSKCIRDSFGRDSNPDSGIGGMVGDGATSMSSGDSGAQSASQGIGLDVGRADLKGGSSGGSSHDGSSSTSHLSHSDLISQFVEGQFLNSELSDDEAGSDDSIHTVTEAESQFSYTKQHGAIRKAGWLVVKNWLVQKKKKLELAPKRNWKKYWVCLKGSVLLFYEDVDSATQENSVPRHILVIEGGIAQSVPEHPKRENIFSLSTSFGDAYLFQASSLTELDLWVCAIHSACAASVARQHGKDNTIKLLRSELHKLETNIDIDVKMRKMAELQLTVVTDSRSRAAIIKQIRQWEENLERLYIEQYKMRCYASSLQGSELPNPKVLLSSMSKASKAALSRLGIFTVSSYHALVCARKPLIMPDLYGKGSQKGGLLSPKGDGIFKYNHRNRFTATGSGSPSVYKATELDEVVGDLLNKDGTASPDSTGSQEVLSKVNIPHNQSVTIGITKRTLAQDILEYVCNKRQLNPDDHYVRVKLPGTPDDNYFYPDKADNIKKMKCDLVEVCQKTCFQVELSKGDNHRDYGIKIEAELSEDYDRDDDLRIYISDVRPAGLAQQRGLVPGDEILVINGKVVSNLDMVFIETLLLESQTVCLTVRSMRAEPPSGCVAIERGDNSVIDNMTCPPPPSQSRISENSIGTLKVPPPAVPCPGESGKSESAGAAGNSDHPLDQIDTLLTGVDQVTAICRDPTDLEIQCNNNRPLSEVEKLRKVIMELIDTERAYVKDLTCMLDRYLEPLKEETFLTSDEIDHVFGNIPEIAQFQRQFLLSLEEAVQLDSPFFTATEMKHYRRVLFSLGGSFLFYANHFKVYSSFCASHSRSQKILNPDTINEKLKEFLIARNPKQQHSATLDSYLIKPIQRILKYPLLLQQLCNLTDTDTDEHHHLSEARKGMEAVAEHINEMQKIYEEYGAIFDDLAKMFKDLYPQKKSVDLSVGELQMYGTVEWGNVTDSLGKIKKGTDLESTVFVFRTGVVFLCRERLKRRKTKSQGNTPGKGLFCDTFDTIERFRTLIPVQDVQVRIGKMNDLNNHYWWELVHSRCDTEARPERVYQFCNNTIEAKTDFMRIIRQTIRDSVRKMTVPSGSQSRRDKYIPYGGKRLEALAPNARTLSSKRSTNTKNQDVERHSMEFEEKFRVLENEAVFRVRSKTVGDLNEVSPEDLEREGFIAVSESDIGQNGSSPGSSVSNLSVSSQMSSMAKLSFASANPVKHSGVTSLKPEGSPIWKPRNQANVAKQLRFKSENGSAETKGLLHLNSPKHRPALRDTEC